MDFFEEMKADQFGQQIKLYCFVMVLGYSRRTYCEFVPDCKMTAFLDCHIRAFEYFGGVPAEILYDNLKNAVLKHLVGRVEYNPTLLDFAAHHEFAPKACPAYAPWVKGKVE